MKKTKCPYCGKKLGYFSAFAEKKRGEHTCNNCGRHSNIFFSKAYKFLIIFTVLVAVVLVVISVSPYCIGNLWCMLLVAIPFLILYLITPFFLKLVPLKNNNRFDFEKFDTLVADDATKAMDRLDDVSSQTKVMSQVHSVDEEELMDISDIDL